MKWASVPSVYRNCILWTSVRTARNFSPARKVLSITLPSLARRSFVRTNAPPFPGLRAAQLRAQERAPLAGLDVLELEDLEDGAVDLDVVAVLELVRRDHAGARLAAPRRVRSSARSSSKWQSVTRTVRQPTAVSLRSRSRSSWNRLPCEPWVSSSTIRRASCQTQSHS